MDKTKVINGYYEIYHCSGYVVAKKTYKEYLHIYEGSDTKVESVTTWNVNKKLLKKLNLQFNEYEYRGAEDDDERCYANNGRRERHYYNIEDLEAIDLTNGDTIYFLDRDNIDNDYQCCDGCGLYFYNTDGYYVERTGECFCSDECLNDGGYGICSNCGEIVSLDDLENIEDTGDDVCSDCRHDSGYFYCEECEQWFSDNCCHYDESSDRYLCDSCYDECGGIIKSYHTAKDDSDWDFHSTSNDERTDGKKIAYMGAELEIEAKGNYSPDDIAQAVNDILNTTANGRIAHFENDGSLSNGVEIIFNPMTINFIYENLGLFEKALTKIDSMGGKSHDTTTCGLHIHYSRLHFYDSNIAKLIYLFEKYRNEIIKFSRRKSEQVGRWAKFYNFNNLDYTNNIVRDEWRPITPIDYIGDNLDDGDRYMAVNLTNNDTIEIRINKGTLKFSTFISCFEFVNNIMQIALDDNIDVKKISFSDILTYNSTKYLLDYCESKHLYTKNNTNANEEVA